MLTEYVAGFMFRRSNSEVALVRKNKPDWQRGKLNGVGGKIEESDCGPQDAMAREFLEETGVATSPAAWSKVAVLDTPGARIHFFRHDYGDEAELQQTTDEHVDWYQVSACMGRLSDVLPNLRWLIPMALDPQRPRAIVNQL